MICIHPPLRRAGLLQRCRAAWILPMITCLLPFAGCAQPGLIGYWKLRGDSRDYSGRGHHAVNHGVALGPDGAMFDGLNHYLEVPDSSDLHLGASDFTISAWVKCTGGVRNVPGDILNKYDPVGRRGINLHVAASSPGYCSLSDQRNLQFGIDNAVEGTWEDCGRPWPSNTLVSTLVVFDGELYTGIADADRPEDTCRMFRYAGGQEWVDCGRVGLNDMKNVSVFSTVVHQGRLYAATGNWDWEKTWHGRGVTTADLARVCRYAGGTTWEDCGQIISPSEHPAFRINSLASFDGHLYATDNTDAVYRWDGDKGWIVCGRPGSIRYDEYPAGDLVAMMPFKGHLYAVKHFASVFRYLGGTQWDDIGEVFHANRAGKFGVDQIHTLGVYRGELYLGTWPDGKVLRYDGGQDYTDCGWLGIDPTHKINEVNDLTVYNGKLYGGAIPKAELWRYEDDQQWTRIRQLVHDPEWAIKKPVTWNRVPCMTIFQGKLFCGTSNCHGRADSNPRAEVGKVFAWEAGKCVSYDRDLGTDWRRIAAVRAGDRLKLYVDGELVATSTAFDPAAFDLSNTRPLLIGFGQENYFNGMIRDVKLYNRALSDAQLRQGS